VYRTNALLLLLLLLLVVVVVVVVVVVAVAAVVVVVAVVVVAVVVAAVVAVVWLSRALLGIGCYFFQFLDPIHSRSVVLLCWGSARRKAYTYTGDNTNRMNPHRHPCL
jgi:hypothetical protein